MLLMRRAFSEAGFGDALRVVSNGEAALEYLRGAGEYANRFTYPMPDVVLLDLNLPRKDGFEVLGWIRSQSALKSMVVIILTASNRSTDADRAYDLGANYYLTKPGNFEALVEMTRCLQEWLKPELVLSDAAQQPRASS